jgi:ribonuclease VapC
VILDSSALVAVVLHEPAANSLARAMSGADELAVGAPTLVETGIVVTARAGTAGTRGLERVLATAAVEVLPFTDDHWRTAVEAFERFGKGRHPAGLNLGDCFSYASARLARRPLLCLGDDFPQTDLAVVARDDA